MTTKIMPISDLRRKMKAIDRVGDIAKGRVDGRLSAAMIERPAWPNWPGGWGWIWARKIESEGKS